MGFGSFRAMLRRLLREPAAARMPAPHDGPILRVHLVAADRPQPFTGPTSLRGKPTRFRATASRPRPATTLAACAVGRSARNPSERRQLAHGRRNDRVALSAASRALRNAFGFRYQPSRRSQAVVLVPHLNGIDWECEQGLRGLEQAGVRVIRHPGCSAIDEGRNLLISNALHDGFETMMFIDSDIGFNPQDALRLLARPEPVVAGVYAKKGIRALASCFADGVGELVFGPAAQGLYPLKYAAAGFLVSRRVFCGA